MAQYLIQNNSKSHVRLPGVTLGARAPFNPGKAWISEDLHNSDIVQSLLKDGTLSVIFIRGLDNPVSPPSPEKKEEAAPQETEATIDYSSLLVKDLRALAAKRGLQSKGLRKQELIDLLSEG